MRLDRGVLVVGFREVDSGKTTVALALIRYLRENGIDACGFKPKAGNSIWYDFDIVYEALMQGRLYGKDAALLKRESQTELPEEVISPVHRLWCVLPADYEAITLEVPHFIADRVTICKNNYEHYVIVNKALPFKHDAENLINKLCQKATAVIYVTGPNDLNEVSGFYDEATDKAYEVISRRHDLIIYESYSDNALPWSGINGRIDLILGVEPGRIHVYDPDRYFLALQLLEGFRREITVNRIRGLIKPLKTIKVPPYRSGEVIDKMKEKMQEILHDFNSC